MASVNVTIRGPLFDKKIEGVIYAAIVEESLQKIAERIERPLKGAPGRGKGQGRKVNRITSRYGRLTLTASSTLRDPAVRRQSIPSFGRGAGRRPNPAFNPRSVGTSWVQKHIGSAGYGKGIIGSMAPSVLRKTAARIIGELS